MKRYLIKVVSDNKDSIYDDQKAVIVLMFVTAENKHRAAYRAAVEVEYRQRYNEYGDTCWEIDKIDKNNYIATGYEMPTLHMHFLPVKENVEVVSIAEQE